MMNKSAIDKIWLKSISDQDHPQSTAKTTYCSIVNRLRQQPNLSTNPNTTSNTDMKVILLSSTSGCNNWLFLWLKQAGKIIQSTA